MRQEKDYYYFISPPKNNRIKKLYSHRTPSVMDVCIMYITYRIEENHITVL